MRILTLAICMVMAGCGGATDSDRSADVEEDTETVFDPLVRSIDKANEVENQVLQHKDRTDEALAESEGLADEADDKDD